MMKLLILFLLTACSSYVVYHNPGTCLTSKEHKGPYEVIRVKGWSVFLVDAREPGRVYEFTNDERWVKVTCPKPSRN